MKNARSNRALIRLTLHRRRTNRGEQVTLAATGLQLIS